MSINIISLSILLTLLMVKIVQDRKRVQDRIQREWSERRLDIRVADRSQRYILPTKPEIQRRIVKKDRAHTKKLIFKENFYVSATKKKHDDLDEFYMWRFNQTSTSSDRYCNWNVKNGSPLYTRRLNNFMILLFDGSIGDESKWKSFELYIKCKTNANASITKGCKDFGLYRENDPICASRRLKM